jgi:hypothetical protein
MDLSDALVKWSTDCMPKGCIISADVLRGHSGDPPNAKDSREYISVAVALNRSDRLPGYVFIQVPPGADKETGVFITFTRTTLKEGKWDMSTDPDGALKLEISGCKPESCMAAAKGGKLVSAKTNENVDLLRKFLSSDSILVLYYKSGRPYDTMVVLSSFKKEYKRVIETELTPPNK